MKNFCNGSSEHRIGGLGESANGNGNGSPELRFGESANGSPGEPALDTIGGFGESANGCANGNGNGSPELRFGEIIRTFLAANLILFFISACLPNVEQIRKNIAKQDTANKQHQQILTQELDANFDNATNVPEVKTGLPEEKTQSLVTLEEGEVSPDWVSELPPECGKQFYCGLAFVGFCENANSCREEAETKARNNLRKQISVKLRSITSSRTYAELSADGGDGHKTFQSDIRERAANIELKNVRFTHFYWRPEKQLQTLARMERPEETEIITKTETPEKIVAGAFPSLLLVFTDNEKTPNLNRKQTQNLFQQRYLEALRAENAVFIAGEIFKDWENLRGNVLRKRVTEVIAEHPGSVVVNLSLSGRLDPYEGKMFKGLATVFLNVAAYGKEGAPLFRKSFRHGVSWSKLRIVWRMTGNKISFCEQLKKDSMSLKNNL